MQSCNLHVNSSPLFFFPPKKLKIEKYDLDLWDIGIIGGLRSRPCQTWCRHWDFLYSFWIKKRAWNRGWIGCQIPRASRHIIYTLFYGQRTQFYKVIPLWLLDCPNVSCHIDMTRLNTYVSFKRHGTTTTNIFFWNESFKNGSFQEFTSYCTTL